MPRSMPRVPVRNSYDRLSRMYDSVFAPFEAPLTDAAVDLLVPQPGEQILEIGPGTGRALARIGMSAGPQGTVLGVDLSAQMLAVSARRLAALAGPSAVRLARGDAQALPIAGGALDAVFMTFTLELFDPSGGRQVLAECAWRSENPNLAVRAYELGHRLFPAVLDCRPIDLEGALREAGFGIQRSVTHSLSGIPVRIVVAAPPKA
jgi:SAM-dependent methyltransferase